MAGNFAPMLAAIYNRDLAATNVQMGVLPAAAAPITVTSGAAYVMGNAATIVADNAAPTTSDYWIGGILAGNSNIAAAGYHRLQFGRGSAAATWLTYITELYFPGNPAIIGEFFASPHYFGIPIKVNGGATSGLVVRGTDSVGAKTIDVKVLYYAGLGS